MMAAGPRVVAELGRPETVDETAARKAESSRVYRSSQTTRNLIAAILATLAVVAVIVWGVPRGSLPAQPKVDVPAAAAQATKDLAGHTLVVAATPKGWIATSAALEASYGQMWRVVYATPPTNFVRIAQGIGASPDWATQVLGGFAPTGTVSIDGLQWSEYAIPAASQSGNITYALATPAGADTILIYGSTTAEQAAEAAKAVTSQVVELRKDAS